MERGKIFCCSAATGKTTACKYALLIDLERHYYQKDVTLHQVITIAVHITLTGRNVALGSGLDWRRTLKMHGVDYTVVLPHIEDKEIYRKRFEAQGRTREHIDNKCGNWDELLSQRLDGEKVVILPKDGYLSRFLEGKYD
jgi:hypothetical protein